MLIVISIECIDTDHIESFTEFYLSKWSKLLSKCIEIESSKFHA